MSISDIIPGFSGGIALTISGKIKEVWSNTEKIRKPQNKGDRTKAIVFYSFFIIGSLAGVFGFAQIINLMLTHIPAITFWFFITLTFGSLFVFFKFNNMKLKELKNEKKKKSIKGILIGFLLMLTVILVTYFLRGTFTLKHLKAHNMSVDIDNIWIKILIYSSGFIGAAAMVTPGVSGALMILMLGSYGYIYDGLYSDPSDYPWTLIFYMMSTVAGSVFSMVILNSLYKRFTIFMNWFFLGTIAGSSIGMAWLFGSILMPVDVWRWGIIVFSIALGIFINWGVVKLREK